MGGGEHDRIGRNLRRIGAGRVGLPPGLVTCPVELRRVDCRQMHHRQMQRRPVMDQLTTQGLGKSTGGELGSAIGTLNRCRPPREYGADLHDRAPLHTLQRRQRAVDGAEVGHFRHAPDFVRRHLRDRAVDGRHRVVDPDGDGAECGLDLVGGAVDGGGVGHVSLDRVDTNAHGLQLCLRVG